MTNLYIVDLEDSDLVYVAWAAGLAQGANNTAAAQALQGIMSRITEFIPGEENLADAVFDGPEDAEYGLDPVEEGTSEEAEREVDPAFAPPSPAPRFGYETGVGPVTGELA